MEKDGIWHEEIVIKSYHLNLKGNATLPAIAYFFQDAAGNHAEARGFGFHDMLKAGTFWVLTRKKIEVVRYPKWQEKITIKTFGD